MVRCLFDAKPLYKPMNAYVNLTTEETFQQIPIQSTNIWVQICLFEIGYFVRASELKKYVVRKYIKRAPNLVLL